MAKLAQQFMNEKTAPGAWFLLLVPDEDISTNIAGPITRRRAKQLENEMHDEVKNNLALLNDIPLVFLLLRYSTRKQKNQQPGLLHLPPSPPALPILGHLHLIGSLTHVSLWNLAAKHGADLMLLRLGAMPALLVTSPRAAEAVLRTHDHVLASRPHSLATEIIMYGHSDIGFAPYGECWRQAKKLVTTDLLNTNKVWSFRLAREDEVSMVMAKISEAAAAAEINFCEGPELRPLSCTIGWEKRFVRTVFAGPIA
ncbi:hypothetical protein EJB05_38059, partial [Eragrostis curvula]